jgi:hypothetical protein
VILQKQQNMSFCRQSRVIPENPCQEKTLKEPERGETRGKDRYMNKSIDQQLSNQAEEGLRNGE